jgi:aspartate dehydrogenase
LLAAGIDVMPLSLSAFGARENEALLMEIAARGPGRLEIPAGAMGSIGFLAAAREEGLQSVLFRAANGPVAWGRTAARDMLDLDAVRTPTVFLRAPVRDLARLFPRSLNVSVGVALAGLGLDRTQAELTVDPALTQARFEVEVSAGPGRAVLRVHGNGRPPGADPVDYTTFSVLRLLLRRDARIMI